MFGFVRGNMKKTFENHWHGVLNFKLARISSRIRPEVRLPHINVFCVVVVVKNCIMASTGSVLLFCTAQKQDVVGGYDQSYTHDGVNSVVQGFPIWGTCTPRGFAHLMGTFNVRSRREKYILILFIYFKKSADFCYFTQPFYHKKFQGYMLICQNAEGVHGQRKIGNPWCSQKSLFSNHC